MLTSAPSRIVDCIVAEAADVTAISLSVALTVRL